MTDPSSHVLVCTVGGSHQPVLTTIRELGPAFVCFLCTDRDPATGQPGSRVQVEGAGSVIKAHPAEERPTLPSVPVQAGLAPTDYEVRIVAADDLDDVVRVAMEAFNTLRGRFTTEEMVADYTGGTKTMTAGLVIAALESPGVQLRLVTGTRSDLIKVHDGSQAGVTALAEGIRLRRAMAPFLAAWEHYGYGAAAIGLTGMPAPRERDLRGEWQIARDLSRGFDAWDRFDHATALRLLTPYRPRIGQRAGGLLKFLEILCGEVEDGRREPARLMDLWSNAQRRAAQGRYDDAVARAYRLLEWTAQWLLRERVGIDTASIPADRVPTDMALTPGRDGVLQAGLYDAWRLVGCLLDGPPATFAQDQAAAMFNHLKARNTSILAHGYQSIDSATWEYFGGWLEATFLPVLSVSAREAGLRMEPPRLPTAPPW